MPLRRKNKGNTSFESCIICLRWIGKIDAAQQIQVNHKNNFKTGYVLLNGIGYFIEPVLEHTPNEHGQLLHVIYKNGNARDGNVKERRCGTFKNWEDSWRERFRYEFAIRNGTKLKRGLVSTHRYLETLVVADKKFLEHHKNTDYESYILTIMNMVSILLLSVFDLFTI